MIAGARNKIRDFTAEDWKLVPLAMLGLARGIGEVIIKPFVVEEAEKVRHIAAASISYYTTGGENGPDEPAA